MYVKGTHELSDLRAYLSKHKKEVARELVNPYGLTPHWHEALSILQSVSNLGDKLDIVNDIMTKIALRDLASQPDEPQTVTSKEQNNSTLKDILEPL
jgi:hypothetical protein